MKEVLMNLSGELPCLIILAACYIIMDRAMFGNRLSKLIREGWAARIRRLRNRNSGLLPLRPADPRKILDTVAWDAGLAGHTGEVSPEPQNNGAGDNSFTPESGQTVAADTRDPVVPPEDYDRVFADSRLEVVPTPDDDEQWVQPVSPDELDTGATYGYPEDYDETGDADYNEIEAAFGFIAGREQTGRERDLAQRAIRNLRGTPMLAELEATKDRIREKIRTAVEETFADVCPEERPAGDFDMGEYM